MAGKEGEGGFFKNVKKEVPRIAGGLLAGLAVIAGGFPEAAALAAGGVTWLLLRRNGKAKKE